MEKTRITNWQIFKEYWGAARKHSGFALLIILGMTTTVIMGNIVVPIMYKNFFDTLQIGGDIRITVDLLTQIILGIAVLNFVAWFSVRLAGFSLIPFEVKVMQEIRQKAFDYILGHSFNFFSNNFTGSLVQKINRFTRAFEKLSDRILMDIVPLLVKVIGITVVLIGVDYRLSIGVLVWISMFCLISYNFTKIKLKLDVKVAEMDSKVSATLSDAISNHNVIQSFTGVGAESNTFRKVNTEYAKVSTKRWNLDEITNAIQTALNYTAEFFVFYFSIKFWLEGTITTGTFVLLQAYIIGLGYSLWQFGRIVRDLYEATTDAREMVEILHLPYDVKDISNAKTLEVTSGAIEYKNIRFAFGRNKEKGRPVFNDFSLSIKPGEKVAIIGSSGAGKSTFVKLLLRLHDIESGEILIDGQNIQSVTQDSLRKNISLVPQDPVLFHRTLMENIRYGRRDATNEEVIEAAKLAHCDIFIKEFPLQYDTFVGERGIKLSGGERQRVAIARALLKNAPILVLDEATSSLDSHSESLIQDALDTLMKGKTTIVIAHRLSTIRKMDRIVVLGKQGVIEEGDHEALIRQNGTYAKLWNLQAGGFSDKSIEDLLG
jgi:ATP-binding cassette subfamily B protein